MGVRAAAGRRIAKTQEIQRVGRMLVGDADSAKGLKGNRVLSGYWNFPSSGGKTVTRFPPTHENSSLTPTTPTLDLKHSIACHVLRTVRRTENVQRSIRISRALTRLVRGRSKKFISCKGIVLSVFLPKSFSSLDFLLFFRRKEKKIKQSDLFEN